MLCHVTREPRSLPQFGALTASRIADLGVRGPVGLVLEAEEQHKPTPVNVTSLM